MSTCMAFRDSVADDTRVQGATRRATVEQALHYIYDTLVIGVYLRNRHIAFEKRAISCSKFLLSCMPSTDQISLGTRVTPVACPHECDV
eukprot:6436-Heterococcus_DN1.PRE.14